MQVAGNQQSGMLSQFLPLMYSQPVQLPGAAVENDSAVYSVAILEGNASLARLLATGLAAESMKVLVHENLDSAMQQVKSDASDLLIMDLDFSGADGQGLISVLRSMKPSMRLVVLSGQGGVERAVEALNRGADEYLVKPFSLLELIARVRALKRRSAEIVSAPQPSAGQLLLLKDQGRVTCGNRSVDLTPRECELLAFMMTHSGTTLSRAVLSQQVWNMPAEANTNIVDVYMKYLRDKLEKAFELKLIRTVRGVGYIFQQQS